MKILFAASEALPFAASGGLADVAGSLPRALRNSRQACRVVLPLYAVIKEKFGERLRFLTSFTVALSWRQQYCGVFDCNVDGMIYYFIDNEYYFKRDGLYGHYDDGERFAFFSKAVLEMLPHIGFLPDIIHTNDWQTALIPVFYQLMYRHKKELENIRTVFTIHNIQYQGRFPKEIAEDVLGISYWELPLLEHDNSINYMKGGIEAADRITTVSPTYAKEILDPWYSHGLDPLLKERTYKLRGILNGIDIEGYDPKTDRNIYRQFRENPIDDKLYNKQCLRHEVGLASEDAMLIGMVTRLTSHKGLDLVERVISEILSLGVQLVVLGSGEPEYEEFFTQVARDNPGRVSVILGFLPELARKIYAGADVFLMPSKSEPCGLAQMVALRYGTIPIVRATGGLRDSIQDLGSKNGNGFTFESYNAHDMLHAIERAQQHYQCSQDWQQYVLHALSCDFSWSRSAKEYLRLYQELLS